MDSNAASNLPSVDDEGLALFGVPNQTGTPERRLLTAILERAILDFVGNDKVEMDDAQTWIFEAAQDTDPSPFSFAWLCRELDLNPMFIASKIKEMPKRGKSRIAPWYSMKPKQRVA
ncbi:MAG: hypothetical protein K1X79_10565 [Oligoflexia bacterium]|nr:hypothetical protein [Oligoflexia bacterium]